MFNQFPIHILSTLKMHHSHSLINTIYILSIFFTCNTNNFIKKINMNYELPSYLQKRLQLQTLPPNQASYNTSFYRLYSLSNDKFNLIIILTK